MLQKLTGEAVKVVLSLILRRANFQSSLSLVRKTGGPPVHCGPCLQVESLNASISSTDCPHFLYARRFKVVLVFSSSARSTPPPFPLWPSPASLPRSACQVTRATSSPTSVLTPTNPPRSSDTHPPPRDASDCSYPEIDSRSSPHGFKLK